MPAQTTESNVTVPSRALLIAAQRPGESERALDTRCQELERLAQTLEVRVIAREIQRKEPLPQTFLGPGKLAELVEYTAPSEGDARAELVLVDAQLSPRQHAALQRAFGVEVLDRSALILGIFERHASSRQATLEVWLAQLRHQLPRIRETVVRRGRQGGGGRGERGHTNVELEKARVREQITKLEKERAYRMARAEDRTRRRSSTFHAALVGYTNAGKTTLLEALTGQAPRGEDRLFATLGTRVRQVVPPTTPAVLVSDTVGFIRDLPHELVASFRSTLDEALAADLLLLVADASAEDWEAQLQITQDTLRAIGGGEVPAQIVLNKVDRLSEDQRAALRALLPDAILISAVAPEDVERLRQTVFAYRDRGLCEETVVVPFADGKRLAEVYARAHVVAQELMEDGQRLWVRAHAQDLDRWSPEFVALDQPDQVFEEARKLGVALASRAPAFEESGLDFRVLRCEGEDGSGWILRAPRRADGVGAGRVEGRALRLVRDRLPVAVPEPALHTPQLIAYPALPGSLAWVEGEAGPELTSSSDATWESVGRLIASIQQISARDARSAGLPSASIASLREKRRGQVEATRAVLRPTEAQLEAWERWLDGEAGWPSHSAFVHGDLHPGHLLLDEAGRVSGVLDWTEASFGDPGLDFIGIYGLYGEEALGRVIASFAAAGGQTWPGMAEHIANLWSFIPVQAASWALERELPEVAEQARGMLGSTGSKAR